MVGAQTKPSLKMQIDQALRQIIRSLYLTNSALFLHLGQPDRDKLSVGSIGELKVRVATRSNETVSLNETCWFDVANVAEFSGFARSMDSSYDRFCKLHTVRQVLAKQTNLRLTLRLVGYALRRYCRLHRWAARRNFEERA